jgi:dTDP-4-amino-4,6-dideoxygalactose transaminase
VYYVYAMQLDPQTLGVSRDRVVDALNAEGVAVTRRYQNIHLLPVYQRKQAYGSKGFPWTSDICRREVKYDKGICPVAEELNDSRYMGYGLCSYAFSDEEVSMVIAAFRKVWGSLDRLR